MSPPSFISSPFATLVWDPFFPPGIVLLLACVLMGMAILAAARASHHPRIPVAVTLLMRLILISLLSLLLLGPSTLTHAARVTKRSSLIFLLDTSASMTTPDMEGRARIQHATTRWLEPSLLEELERDHRVRVFTFDEGLKLLATAPRTLRPPSATGRQTLLAQSVARVVARIPTKEDGASLVVLSDGRDTQRSPPAPEAAEAVKRGVTIHTVTFGSEHRATDLSLLAEVAQPYLFVNEEGRVLVSVHQTGGDLALTRVHLDLLPSGTPTLNAEVSQVHDVRFDGRSTVQLAFTLKHSEPGEYAYRIRVHPLDNEAELSNNERTVFVEVLPTRMRILMLEGEPGWDTKFLALSLRKDERIELTQVSQISKGRREVLAAGDIDAAALPPTTVEGWRHYDLVILGRSLEHLMTPESAASLVEYVSRHGGRLLMARSRPWSRVVLGQEQVILSLAVLEPAEVARTHALDVTMTPTESGWRSACFDPTGTGENRATTAEALSALPAATVLTRVTTVKPGTVVLATGSAVNMGNTAQEPVPLLMSMRYGSGEVAAVHATGLWRWTLGAADVRERADRYDRFWSGLVRQLVLGSDAKAGESLSLRPMPRTAAIGDSLRLELTARSEVLAREINSMEILLPDGASETLMLTDDPLRSARRYATFTPRIQGIHRARVRDPVNDQWIVASFSADDATTIERLDTTADPMWMQTLAVNSGGQVLNPDNPRALLDVMAQHRAMQDSSSSPIHIWNRFGLLVALLLWVGVEWLVRRIWGMP